MPIKTITGTDLADDLIGTEKDELIRGLDGDDYLNGKYGDDILVGDRGNDIMKGGRGDDTMVWNNGDGSDVMHGGKGYDKAVVNGADGAGDVFTIEDADYGVLFQRTNLGPFTIDIKKTEKLKVNGLGGDDKVDASGLSEGQIKLVLNGGHGDDTIIGSQGEDHMRGGKDNDLLIGGRGNDNVKGGSGDDTMVWNNGDGSDIMNGGKGYDETVVNAADGPGDIFTIEDGADGVFFQRINLGLFNLQISNTEKLTVNGQAGDDEVDASALSAGLIDLFVDGGKGDDKVVGSQGDDYLEGGYDNDLLIGDRGNDIMKGGRGNDTMVWNNGDGSDVMHGGKGYDKAVVNGADGAGDVFTIEDADYGVLFQRTNLGPFTIDIKKTEKLKVNGLGGDDEVDASGLSEGEIKLVLDGGHGDDTITGSQGDDLIRGGKGNDDMTGGHGADAFVFEDGHDVVTDFEDGEDVIVIKQLADYSGYGDVAAVVEQVEDDVVISFASGDSLTLEDTHIAAIDASDFVFA